MRFPEPNEATYRWKTSEAAARRMHDWLVLHHKVLPLDQKLSGRAWVAIKLSDGDSDGIVYESRREAYTHQFHPLVCLYHKITPPTAPPVVACDILLWFTRRAYDNGYRPDEDGPDLAIPNLSELTRAARLN